MCQVALNAQLSVSRHLADFPALHCFPPETWAHLPTGDNELAALREWNLFRDTECYDYSKVYSVGCLQSILKLTGSGLARTQSNNSNNINDGT